MKYQYLLWDIDGTVLDFHAAEEVAILSLCEKYQICCSKEQLSLYSEINGRYWEALERNEMTKQQILVGRFQEFFHEIGADESLAARFNEDYQLALGDTICFQEQADEMLQKLKGDYILIAVTNGTKVAQEKKLRLSGLDQVFDFTFISEDVGVEKPNREFFDFVFEKTQVTDVSKAIIIGDSLTSDIKGGNQAGIDTCWYNPKQLQNTKGINATYEITHLEEFYDILK